LSGSTTDYASSGAEGDNASRLSTEPFRCGFSIARRLLLCFAGHAAVPTQASRVIFVEPPDRGRETLGSTAAGRDKEEIAGKLFRNLKTVRNYVSNIFTIILVSDHA
jgi:DNA-binding NarL/FixJ family response regulator